MGHYIHSLILKGEGMNLDFKYCISDPRKIARTLSAFSNSEGGKLLIGVRDNGSLAGVRSDEEYYMIDAAAKLYCNPEVTFSSKNHTINGKNILEVDVPRSGKIPVKAKDETGRWKAYLRQNDQNFMADRVILQVWRRAQKARGLLLRFEETENLLLVRREELSRQRSRLESLEQLERNLDGYGRGVRTLLADATQRGRVGGLLADTLDVPAEYEVAVEAVDEHVETRLAGPRRDHHSLPRERIEVHNHLEPEGFAAIQPRFGAVRRPPRGARTADSRIRARRASGGPPSASLDIRAIPPPGNAIGAPIS